MLCHIKEISKYHSLDFSTTRSSLNSSACFRMSVDPFKLFSRQLTIASPTIVLKLEIEADVPGGLDRAKVRTLVENANTLGFIEKSVE